MKLTLLTLTAAASIGLMTPVLAQSTQAAPGVVAPDSPRALPNGEVAPPPSTRAAGGVGANEIKNDNAQTRSGGPSGGRGNNN